MELLYKGFSCPHESLDDDILNYIVCSHAQEQFTLFFNTYKEQFPFIEDSIIDLFKTAITQINSNSFWNIPLGLIKSKEESVSYQKFLSILLSTVLGYLYTTENNTFNISIWNIQSDKPFDVFIGSCYYPEILSVYSEGGDSGIIIKSANNTSYALYPSQEFSILFEPIYDNIHLQTQFPAYLDFLGRNKQFPSNSSLTEEIKFYRKVFKLVKKYSPEYLPWIIRLSRILLITPGNTKKLFSGSSPDWLGILSFSYPSSLIAAAEMLVHECSHQYYFVSKYLDEHDAGNYDELYYSPIKNTGRPIWAILTAYHAFANVVLFYRSCIKNGLKDRGYCKKNELILLPQLKQLEDVLIRYDSFTSLGESLWKPLSARLSQI